jgi:hypothetical protein
MAATGKQGDFGAQIAKAYTFDGPALDPGRGVHEGKLVPEAVIRMPLSMVNRHGLIAGATGTGKTKTLQLLTEQLSAAGVPVFAADLKGDVSGLAAPGETGGPAAERDAELGIEYKPESYPVEFLSLGGIGSGVPVRSTVSDFGPQLLGKVLGANETQEQSLSLVFRFASLTSTACRCSTSPICARCSSTSSPKRGKPSSRVSAASRSRRSGFCCARSLSSRTAAATSSSASRSSRSRTCCGPQTTAAASSPASSCRRCRTSRRCSRLR